MRETLRKVSSIGLVAVFVATVLMSFPLVSAPPPGACEPWPECKGAEEPPADPAIAFFHANARGGDKIVVMNADGSNQAVIFQQENLRVTRGPSWSPDGNSVAWSGYTYVPNIPGSDHGIWRIDVEIVDGVPQGTNLQQLVAESEEGSFSSIAWSPLGNEIAYAIHLYDPDRWVIDAVPAPGGDPYNVYTAPEGHAIAISSGLAWSSDGTQLAAEGSEIGGGDRSIIIIDRATGTVAQRLSLGQFDIAGLDWARQGSSKLIFHEMGSGIIYTLDIDSGTTEPVIEGAMPSWSPDNSKIVYIQPRSGKLKRSTNTYEFTTGDITQLAKGGTEPDWRRF